MGEEKKEKKAWSSARAKADPDIDMEMNAYFCVIISQYRKSLLLGSTEYLGK
jgi:hypothetical protein